MITRITLRSAISLSGQNRQKCPFTLPARATNLNKHGAAIQLHRDLSLGPVIEVKNRAWHSALSPCRRAVGGP